MSPFNAFSTTPYISSVIMKPVAATQIEKNHLNSDNDMNTHVNLSLAMPNSIYSSNDQELTQIQQDVFKKCSKIDTTSPLCGYQIDAQCMTCQSKNGCYITTKNKSFSSSTEKNPNTLSRGTKTTSADSGGGGSSTHSTVSSITCDNGKALISFENTLNVPKETIDKEKKDRFNLDINHESNALIPFEGHSHHALHESACDVVPSLLVQKEKEISILVGNLDEEMFHSQNVLNSSLDCHSNGIIPQNKLYELNDASLFSQQWLHDETLNAVDLSDSKFLNPFDEFPTSLECDYSDSITYPEDVDGMRSLTWNGDVSYMERNSFNLSQKQSCSMQPDHLSTRQNFTSCLCDENVLFVPMSSRLNSQYSHLPNVTETGLDKCVNESLHDTLSDRTKLDTMKVTCASPYDNTERRNDCTNVVSLCSEENPSKLTECMNLPYSAYQTLQKSLCAFPYRSNEAFSTPVKIENSVKSLPSAYDLNGSHESSYGCKRERKTRCNTEICRSTYCTVPNPLANHVAFPHDFQSKAELMAYVAHKLESMVESFTFKSSTYQMYLKQFLPRPEEKQRRYIEKIEAFPRIPTSVTERRELCQLREVDSCLRLEYPLSEVNGLTLKERLDDILTSLVNKIMFLLVVEFDTWYIHAPAREQIREGLLNFIWPNLPHLHSFFRDHFSLFIEMRIRHFRDSVARYFRDRPTKSQTSMGLDIKMYPFTNEPKTKNNALSLNPSLSTKSKSLQQIKKRFNLHAPHDDSHWNSLQASYARKRSRQSNHSLLPTSILNTFSSPDGTSHTVNNCHLQGYYQTASIECNETKSVNFIPVSPESRKVLSDHSTTLLASKTVEESKQTAEKYRLDILHNFANTNCPINPSSWRYFPYILKSRNDKLFSPKSLDDWSPEKSNTIPSSAIPYHVEKYEKNNTKFDPRSTETSRVQRLLPSQQDKKLPFTFVPISNVSRDTHFNFQSMEQSHTLLQYHST